MDPHAHPGPVASAYAARRRAYEDAWLSPDNRRYLAEQIPGAQLLELL